MYLIWYIFWDIVYIMNNVCEEARAKINLSLDITGKRSDGYHLVSMIMQTLSLHDDVTVAMRSDGNISFSLVNGATAQGNPTCGSGDGVRGNTVRGSVDLSVTELSLQDNLCVKACRAMKETFGIASGFDISLVKRIPVAAGLAGGSADAAAVMRAVRTETGLSVSDDALREAALPLGADIPYCIAGGTALAEGIGEKLTSLPSFGRFPVVIVKPAFPISTAEAYGTYDTLAERGEQMGRPDQEALLRALSDRDYRDFSAGMKNVLREVALRKHPEIAAIEEELKRCGAYAAMMSGSGPAVFGLFEEKAAAEQAAKTFAARDGIECAVCCETCGGV